MNATTPTATSPAPAETALIVFAQSDLRSSLQSTAWCQAAGTLDTLFVYCTEATADDGERLRKLCNRQWPSLKVVVPGEAGDDSPVKVVERLRDWRAFRPTLPRWVVDSTGALPSMLAGITRAATQSPGWLILNHRTLDDTWQRLAPGPDGRLDPAPAAPGDAPPRDAADQIPLHLLLPSLYPGADEVTLQWRDSRAPETLTIDELVRIVQAGGAANWDWSRMYEQALGKPDPHGDWGFDDFIGATLVLLGAANTRIHLPARLAAKRPCEHIFDVVTVYEGTLWLIDCRPRAEPAPPILFDGRLWLLEGARRLVVRPGRWGTLTERLLSDLHTTLLDCDDCRTLFTRLGNLLGTGAPRALRDIERETLSTGASRVPVFTPATPAQQFSDAIRLDTCVFDLQRGARADAGGTPPPWMAARVAPDLWFIGGNLPKPAPAPELRQRLDNRLGKSRLDVRVIFFEVSPDRLAWRSLVRIQGDSSALGKWLTRWHNSPLIV